MGVSGEMPHLSIPTIPSEIRSSCEPHLGLLRVLCALRGENGLAGPARGAGPVQCAAFGTSGSRKRNAGCGRRRGGLAVSAAGPGGRAADKRTGRGPARRPFCLFRGDTPPADAGRRGRVGAPAARGRGLGGARVRGRARTGRDPTFRHDQPVVVQGHRDCPSRRAGGRGRAHRAWHPLADRRRSDGRRGSGGACRPAARPDDRGRDRGPRSRRATLS